MYQFLKFNKSVRAEAALALCEDAFNQADFPILVKVIMEIRLFWHSARDTVANIKNGRQIGFLLMLDVIANYAKPPLVIGEGDLQTIAVQKMRQLGQVLEGLCCLRDLLEA